MQKSACGVVLCRPSCVPFSNSRSMLHYMGHSWQWSGEDPLHSSKAYQGRGVQLSYWNVTVKSVPSKCFLGRLLKGSELRTYPDETGFLPLSHGLIWGSQQSLCPRSSSSWSLVGSVAESPSKYSTPLPISRIPQMPLLDPGQESHPPFDFRSLSNQVSFPNCL